jgi:hypothetical protein
MQRQGATILQASDFSLCVAARAALDSRKFRIEERIMDSVSEKHARPVCSADIRYFDFPGFLLRSSADS